MERFKFGATGADERFVNDPAETGSPRAAHDPVKDPGGTPATATSTVPPPVPAGSNPDPTGFRFNLDDALARLSEPHQPIPRFKWSAVTPSEPSATGGPMHATTLAAPPAGPPVSPAPTSATSVGSMFPDQESRGRPLTQPTLDPLPEIREATVVGGNPPAAHWSTVPVHVPPPVASPPSSFPVPAVVTSAPAGAPMVVTGSEAFAAGAFGFTPDSDYAPGPVGLRDNSHVDGGMPRLPDSDPAAAPPMATMVSSTALAHAAAARPSTAAKGRKKRKRNRFGKVVLVLFLIVGLVGAALMFGRDYLFPEDWDKDVVPAVEALQLRSGLEFTDPVPVVTLSETEYAAKVASVVFGPGLSAEWQASIPRWRALGLVDGEPTLDSVNGVVSAWMPAFYDPTDGQIYRTVSGTASTTSTAALRDALAAALIHQLAGAAPAPVADPNAPIAIVSPTDSLAQLAVDDFGAELVAGVTTATDPDRSAFSPLPVPLAHRLIGIDDLGAPIVESLDGVADSAAAITGFDVDVTGALDVPWTAAPVPALIAGDTADGDAVARGSDFWYTVLAAYLPAETAADAANSIGADLYSPAARGAQQCVYGTFTAARPDVLGVLQISAIAWAELAPTQAGASATTLPDGVTVQLVTCDPGTGPDATRTPDVAAALIARQVARLNPA